MSDEQKDPWMNYLALTTVIFAVCATLSTFKGGSYSTRSVISQAQASDQWAFFQAKSIRESMYRLQKDNVALAVAVLPKSAGQDVQDRYQAEMKKCEENIAKYEHEKADIQQEAKRLESMRDDAQHHGQPFGLAVIFLQVAILLSSVAGLFKRKPIWYLALPIGVLGTVCFLDGIFLFL